MVIVETKGLEDLDVPRKMRRLKQWCADINQTQENQHFDYIFVGEESFHQYPPKSFNELITSFKKYKD